MKSEIFQTRADEQRHFEGSRPAFRQELDARARFHGAGNVRFLAFERIAADTGVQRRRRLTDDVFIAALVSVYLASNAPLFQLCADFRLQPRAIRELGAHERGEKFRVARSTLPIIEGERRHGHFFHGERLLVLFQFDKNLFLSDRFQPHEIEGREDVAEIHFHRAFKRHFLDRFDRGSQKAVFVAHRQSQVGDGVGAAVFDLQRGEQRGLRKIIGIRHHAESFGGQGDKFFCFFTFLRHNRLRTPPNFFPFYYTLNL